MGKVGEAPPSVSAMCKKEVCLNFLKYAGDKRGPPLIWQCLISSRSLTLWWSPSTWTSPSSFSRTCFAGLWLTSPTSGRMRGRRPPSPTWRKKRGQRYDGVSANFTVFSSTSLSASKMVGRGFLLTSYAATGNKTQVSSVTPPWGTLIQAALLTAMHGCSSVT